MPPTPPVTEAAFAVTAILAPAVRSSRLILSPMLSMTPSIAVATAEPRAMARMVRALRRGDRRMESCTKRIITVPLRHRRASEWRQGSWRLRTGVEDSDAGVENGGVDDER